VSERALGLSRRTATMVVSAVLLVVLVSVATLLPVPYVALLPGPTTDTLGTVEGKPLIRIEGVRTYEPKGHLNLTTVKVRGGPGQRFDLVTAFRGWLDSTVAVVPQETVFPPGSTVEQVEERNAEEMELSQQSATTAALRQLGYEVTSRVAVGAVVEGAPALGKLKAGDTILAVDGQPISTPEQVGKLIRAHQPGEKVAITVERDGKRLELSVPTRASAEDPSAAVVGIVPREVAKYPFEVEIQLKDVGGPSAGLMFALGIIDRLNVEDITGGAFVAGTGTIDDAGKVGPIGGIQQKLVAARDAGATVFLTPAANCSDAAAATPDGLRLVRVDDLGGALSALDSLRTGRGGVPSCAG
jgi:PDZ domain-containing protein